MCGRFLNDSSPQELVRWLEAAEFGSAIPSGFRPRYNIAPSQQALCLLDQSPKPTGPTSLTFGIKRPPRGLIINARAETARLLPTFKQASCTARCAVLSTGYFEWQQKPNGPKTPHVIRPVRQKIFALAGLVLGNNHFVILTTESTGNVTPIHARMPVILDVQGIKTWVSSQTLAEEAFELASPGSGPTLCAEAVSTRVNSPRFDDELCIQRV